MDNNISIELARLRWHQAALRFEVSMLRHAQAMRRKCDPSQHALQPVTRWRAVDR